MTPLSQPRVRRLGALPWDHDGYERLALWAGADVPTFDDPMIKGALARCAHTCERLQTLDRAVNRELWPLGYVGRIEAAETDGSTANVMILNGR